MNLAEYQAVMNRLAAAEAEIAELRAELHDLKNAQELEGLAAPKPKDAPKK